MKFMLLIVDGDPNLPMPTQEQLGPMMATFQKIGADLGAAGKLISSERLCPQAEGKTVRLSKDGKRTVVDGPFTETKEAVGGYYLADFASEAEALEWAKKFPPFFHIEVRQVRGM
jgi:hypothetical protein